MITDDCILPSLRFPDYFANYEFKEPESDTHTRTPLRTASQERNYGKKMKNMAEVMKMTEMMFSVTGTYDFGLIADYAKTHSGEIGALIVDVGGGFGNALRTIINEYSEITASRCVLQGRAEIAEAEKVDENHLKDVQKTPYDYCLHTTC